MRWVTHVVCQPDQALKWLSMGENNTDCLIVTPTLCTVQGAGSCQNYKSDAVQPPTIA